MPYDETREPRSWDEPEELDRFVHQLRDQIEGLKARVRVYRTVIGGEDPDGPGADAQP